MTDTLQRAVNVDSSGYVPVAPTPAQSGSVSAQPALVPGAPSAYSISPLPASVLTSNVSQQQTQVANIPQISVPITSASSTNTSSISSSVGKALYLSPQGIMQQDGIDFSLNYKNQNQDYIPDGETYSRVLSDWVAKGVPYNFQGAWSAGNVYDQGAEVTDGGNYWLALIHSTNSEPSLNNLNWQILGPTSLDSVADGDVYGKLRLSYLEDSGQLIVNEFPGAILNPDGSISGVNGVVSSRTFPVPSAGSAITVTMSGQKALVGDYLGVAINSFGSIIYHVNWQPDNNFVIDKFVGGVTTPLAYQYYSTSDTEVHSVSLTVVVGSPNTIIATIDGGLTITATDTDTMSGNLQISLDCTGKLWSFDVEGITLDAVPDGSTYKRATAAQISGANRALIALNADNQLVTGTPAHDLAQLEAGIAQSLAGLNSSGQLTTGTALTDVSNLDTAAARALAALNSANNLTTGTVNKTVADIEDAVSLAIATIYSAAGIGLDNIQDGNNKYSTPTNQGLLQGDIPYNNDWRDFPSTTNLPDGWALNGAAVSGGGDAMGSRGGTSDGRVGSTPQLVGGGPQGGSISSRPFAVKPGANYNLSCYVYGTVANTGSLFIRISWYNQATSFSYASQESWSNIVNAGGVSTANAWQFFSGIITAPSDAIFGRVELYNYGGTACSFYFDYPRVQESLQGTSSMQDNSITNSGEYSNDSSQSFGYPGETQVGSITVSTNGGTVIVMGKLTMSIGSPPGEVNLRKDSITGTLLDQCAANNNTVGMVMAIDASPAATQTYVISAFGATGAGSVNQVRLIGLNTKK